MALVIRPAGIDDLASLTRLIQELIAQQNDPAGHLTVEAVRRDGMGANSSYQILVAEEAGTLEGYALFMTAYETAFAARGLYLSDLYVRPARRGRGIGRALVAAVARQARERGGCFLWWVSKPWNQGAQAFYRKLGASAEPVIAHALTLEAFAALADQG